MKQGIEIGNIETDNRVFLAPMAGVTDIAYRQLAKELGAGMVYSEMVSAKGLTYGSKRTADYLTIQDRERPVVIQIFGSEPAIMAEAAKMVAEYKPDIIDINMGCPTPKIVNNGDGSALMKDLDLAEKVIRATVEATTIPVTVKMRAGWDEDNMNAVELSQRAEQAGAKAVAIHGRTRSQFYSGHADWQIIRKVKQAVSIPVVGNGDVTSPESAKELFDTTGCDAIMVGRGALGNPWLFRRINLYLKIGEVPPEPGPEDRIQLARKHLRLAVEYKGERDAVPEMRSHIAWYLKGLHGGNRIKKLVYTLSSFEEVDRALEDYLNSDEPFSEV